MDVPVGLDVSPASTSICVLGEKGGIVTEAQVAGTPEALVAFMRDRPHGTAATGPEAGPLSQWLHEGPRLHEGPADAGFGTVPMETRQVKAALKAMPVKTDRRDGEGLARLLQMGWFRPVHCKSVSSQEMRALPASRKSVLDALIGLELSLRGVLRNFGLKAGPRQRNGPALGGHTAEAVCDAIAKSMQDLPEHLRKSLTWDQGAQRAQHEELKLDIGSWTLGSTSAFVTPKAHGNVGAMKMPTGFCANTSQKVHTSASTVEMNWVQLHVR